MEQEDTNKVKTVIAHDVDNPVAVTSGGNYTHTLDYTYTDAVGMDMLISGSQRCEQTVKIECQGAQSVQWEAIVGHAYAKCTCTTGRLLT